MTASQEKVLHTYYENNFIEVVDQDEFRSLYFHNKVVQSRMSLQEPHRLILKYTQYMMAAALLVKPVPTDILLIGIGAGALVHFLHHHFPSSPIDAVDYSEHVIKIARGYFSLPENDHITIHCIDGLDFLRKRDNKVKYDLILVDAFNDCGMAKNIYSNEFLSLAKQSISPEGTICCNLWSGNSDTYNKVQKAIRKNSTSSIFIPVNRRENIIALLFQTQPPWRQICLPDKILMQLSARYSCNFSEVSQSAKQHNLRLGERVQLWLS